MDALNRSVDRRTIMSQEHLQLHDVRAIFRLVGEVRELGYDPNVWRPHMVLRLRRIVDAQVVVSSEVHFRTIGRGPAMRMIDIGWGSSEEGKVWQIHTERDGEVPEHYWLSAIACGPRVGRQPESELVPVAPARKVYGGRCFILSQVSLPHIGAVDQLGLHRQWGDAPFTRPQHRLVRLLHLELARLWRRDVLRRIKDPTTTLPPRLSQTLHELMAGQSEKQIALKLGLSRHTIHNYVKALHQRFGVSSRGELLARAAASRADFIPQFSVDVP